MTDNNPSFINNLPGWLKTSNRWKHGLGIMALAVAAYILLYLLYGGMMWQHYIVVACIAAAVSAALEFKDVHHANGDIPIQYWAWQVWDWLDIAAGMLGYFTVTLLVIALVILF